MKNLSITLLSVFILINLYGCSGESDPEDSYSKLLAYNYATDFVKQSLKSPSTAKFPGSDEKVSHVNYLGNSKYKILSWVESQNGFGATVRTNFKCVIKVDKENSSVTKEELTIN